MTAPVFHVDPARLAEAAAGDTVLLDGPEGRHAATVRRLAVGEPIELVDGAGRRLSGTVVEVVDRAALAIRAEAVADEPDPSPRVIVVQALPKGDRGELAVELLTEVGVDVIVPWAAAACVTQWRPDRVERAHRRWRDAASAAGKQSRRARFPVVAPLASTADVAALVAGSALGVLLHEEAAEPIGGLALPPAGDVVIVVGPEGGITADEADRLVSAGARAVRLGPSVLRTSSAGMAAAAALLAPSRRWLAGLVTG